MTLLDGNKFAQKILAELKTKITPGQINLDIILVGDNPASLAYTHQKQKKAQQIGIGGQIHQFSADSDESEITQKIHQLNLDPAVTGIMVQLPLPPHLDKLNILNAINPAKDADGLTATNLGLLFQNHPRAIPSATAQGIINLMAEYHIDLLGKNAVIINRSLEVGLPLAAMLKNQNATVTICHSQTKNLQCFIDQADILITAANKPNFIKATKPQAVVVDVGYPQGDVDFDLVSTQASYITPVPGGVGPTTVATLLQNTYRLSKK